MPDDVKFAQLFNARDRTLRLGIDLGGTKIEGIIVDGQGVIISRKRIPTPVGNYAAILAAVGSLIDELEQETGQPKTLPVGIGTPGSESLSLGTIRNSNSTCLNGQPLRQDLEKVLARPVRMANDADCFTLSEATDGAATGSSNVFGVILGTGVGGGVCVNGQLISGVNRITGEWGHNPLALNAVQGQRLGANRTSRTCFCGRVDCVETWLAGPALSQSYFDHTGKQATAAEVAALAVEGDADAIDVMADYFELLALALANVINIIDPETIVLGGGVSNIPALYHELPRRLPKYVFSNDFNTRIVRAVHGDSSGVRGAAWLWPALSGAASSEGIS